MHLRIDLPNAGWWVSSAYHLRNGSVGLSYCQQCGAPVPRTALRAARERRGEVREDTAEALGVSPVTLGRWERGETEVSLAYRKPIAAHFGISLDDVETWLCPSCQICKPRSRPSAPSHEVGQGEDRSRKVLRNALASSSLVVGAPMLGAASRLPGTLGEGDLDDLEAAIDGYGRAYPNEPPSALLPAVIRDFGDLTVLRADREKSQVASASARLAGLAGGLLNNLGCPREADGWLAKAAVDAESSGDPTAAEWVRTRVALWPLHHGQQQRVIDEVAGGTGATASAGILALLKARAHADLGNPRDALAAVAQAERAAVSGTESNVFTLSEAAFFWWASAVFARIGALNEAEWVRRAYPGTRSIRDQAEFDLDGALCLANAGEPEAAAELATKTLQSLPVGQRTSYIMADAADLADELTGCDAPAVREYVGTYGQSHRQPR